MSKCVVTRKVLIAFLLSWISIGVNATEIEYQFSGNLSGFNQAQIFTQPIQIQLTDAPFQVTIFGDTNNVNGWTNNGSLATWNINGVDTASTAISQVSSLMNVIAFTWAGETFNADPSVPLGQYFGFSGNFPNIVPSYYSTVPQTPISLVNSLTDPTRLPVYTTSILFPNIGSFTLTGMSNMTYSVTPVTAAVPEPESHAMMLAGMGLIGFIARRRKLSLEV